MIIGRILLYLTLSYMLFLNPFLLTENVNQNEVLRIKNIFEIYADDNRPPNPPDIDGPISGQIWERYYYSFLLTDPDYGDMLLTLEINWGDDMIQREGGRWCLKPWQNGSILDFYHSWDISGTYNISARVQDVYGDWSDWSEPLQISMPKCKLK